MESNTTQTLTILPATQEHLSLLLEFRRSMFRDMGIKDEKQIEVSIAEFGPWLSERLDDEQIFAPIGSVEGTPVACAIAWIYDWYPGFSYTSIRRGYIFNVYTQPDWRRRGYSGQLVQSCIDWFREKGVESISLHASSHGQSVYANKGFKPPRNPEMVLRF